MRENLPMPTRVQNLYRAAMRRNAALQSPREEEVFTERPAIALDGSLITIRHYPTPSNPPRVRGSRRLVPKHRLTVPPEDLGLTEDQARALTCAWR